MRAAVWLLLLVGWWGLGAAATPASIPFADFMNNAPSLPASGAVVTLPARIEKVIAGMGGAYLVMKLEKETSLRVFNIPQLRFETPIRLLEDRVLMAAGGNRLLVYMPKNNVMELWDLQSLTRQKSRTVPLLGKLESLYMGLLNADTALLLLSEHGEGRYQLVMLDLEEMVLLPKEKFTPIIMQSHNPIAVSEDMKTAIVSFNWSLRRFDLDSQENSETFVHGGFFWMRSAADGGRVYVNGGTVYDQANLPCRRGVDCSFYPILHSNMSLEVRHRDTLILCDDNFNPIWERPAPFDLFAHGREEYCRMEFPDMIWPVAPIDRLVLIRNLKAEHYLHVSGLNIPAPGQMGVNSGPVAPGGTWTVMTPIDSGASVAIEDAPAGVIFEKVSGRLTWTVPADTVPGNYLVLLSIRMGKDETYRRYNIRVR